MILIFFVLQKNNLQFIQEGCLCDYRKQYNDAMPLKSSTEPENEELTVGTLFI